MHTFNNVLVGIDFSQVIDPEKAEFKPPVEQAIKWAIWVGEHHSARLTFFSALEVQGEFWSFLGEDEQKRLSDGAHSMAEKAMVKLVDRARQAGVQADAKLAQGKGWIELIRQAEQGEHDVVIVGTRDVGAVSRLLFGTTAMKLIRKCPVPVWVARPQPQLELQKVLVAVDLRPTCSQVVELGLAFQKLGAKSVELLHAVDIHLDHYWSPFLPDKETLNHDNIRSRARQHLDEELRRQTGGEIPPGVKLTLIDGSTGAGPAIRHYIEQNPVDLLVMGTLSHHGEAGYHLGGTAEWLLPQIPCSLLAIKPADFQGSIPAE